MVGACLAALLGACDRNELAPAPQPEVVGTFRGGQITKNDLERSAQNLPPLLRQEFGTTEGRREMTRSLIDRQLLLQEARRQSLQNTPDIADQVRELEERLILRKLLADEEKKSPLDDAELRAWYAAHRGELTGPDHVRVSRVIASNKRGNAMARAQGFAKRLRKGEAVAQVAKDGDGEEKSKQGDLGFITPGDLHDPTAEAAVLALKTAGAVSPPVTLQSGVAVFILAERVSGKTPGFEEARAQIAAQLQPMHQRKVFDALLARLRATADAQVAIR